MTNLENTAEQHRQEAFLHNIESTVRTVFPEYSVMDRIEYNAYDPATDSPGSNDDNKRGRILYFYTESGKAPDAPNILIITKPSGFVVNYYSSPDLPTRKPLRNAGNSIFGPRQARWQEGQEALALEKAKIQMEGIDLQDEVFQRQITRLSPTGEGFLTMNDVMENYKQLQGQPKALRTSMKAQWEALRYANWDLLDTDPAKVTELAVARIMQQPQYTSLDGSTRAPEEVCEQIRQGTAEGRAAILRELNSIDAQESLLRQRRLL